MLGETTPARWTNDELDRYLIQSIRKVRDSVPLDALKDLLYTLITSAGETTDGTGVTTGYLSKPDNMYKLVSITSEESDGNYGYPWTYVTENVYIEIRRREGDMAYTSTNTRIFTEFSINMGQLFTVDPPVYHWMLYPSPGTTYKIRLSYVKAPAESGTMTLPNNDPNLLNLVVLDTVAKAALKDSYNLDLFKIARDEYNSDLGLIRIQYTNKYGLTPASIGVIRNVVGIA